MTSLNPTYENYNIVKSKHSTSTQMLNFLLSQFEGGHGGVEEFRQPKQQQPMNEQEHPYPGGSQ